MKSKKFPEDFLNEKLKKNKGIHEYIGEWVVERIFKYFRREAWIWFIEKHSKGVAAQISKETITWIHKEISKEYTEGIFPNRIGVFWREFT